MVARTTILVVVAMAGACHKTPPPAVPGHTDIAIASVAIEARAGEQLTISVAPLFENLGLRAKTLTRPERSFNEFRLAEDRRRIAAYFQGYGHFDVEVDEPELVYSDGGKRVAVTWHVHEGVRYTLSAVELIGVPAEHDATLRAMIKFSPGDPLDMDTFRPLRRDLAERLQDEGYGHARGYSRTFVDQEKKTVAWFFYIDAGPKTHIGSVNVEGNNKVPAEVILERAGLAPGRDYSTAEKRRAELALLDAARPRARHEGCGLART